MKSRSHRRKVVGSIFAVLAVLSLSFLVFGKFDLQPNAEPEELMRYMPIPAEEGKEESESLAQLELQWNDRLTYPTGRFNPGWIREAAVEDASVESVVPQEQKGKSSDSPFVLNTAAFTALGPQPLRMTGCNGCYNYTTTQGRVNAIVVDPTTTTNGSIVAYAGTIGGGVWKTTDCCTSATSWVVVTDDPLISTTAIDALALDPNDHNTIYAGTGDLNYGSFSMGSQGILKSSDAGATWTLLGADVFGPMLPQPAGEFPQYQAVGKVRVDPNNSNNVVAGTKTGLYMSYDGGVNWTGPCLTNGFTTQRQDITGLELSNVGGATRIVAAVGVRGFATTVQYNLGANGANGLYRAAMPVSGCPAFDSIASNSNGFVFGPSVSGSAYTTGALLNAGSGAPYVSVSSGNQLGRIDIAVAPSDPNVIYAQVQSIAANNNSGCGNTSGCQMGVWVTTDGGTSWSFMTGSAGGSLRNCSSGQGDYPQNWYDQGLAVDPNNPDRLFVDTYEVWYANRTGTSFNNLTCGYSYSGSAGPVHVDQHALAFVPGSSSILVIGNDGGVHVSTNADVASATVDPTWTNLNNNGLNTIEFYSGDISANFATSASPQANGGAQDNGSMAVTFSGSPTGPVQWQMGKGGDGFYARIDPLSTRMFQGNNSGRINRCTSNCTASGSSWSVISSNSMHGDQQSFILPYEIFKGTPDNPSTDCSATTCNHMIAGTVRVWETINAYSGGSSSWYVNSPANLTKQSLGNRSFINQLAYAPKSSAWAIVGTNDGNVQIGRGLGTGSNQATWVDVTGGNTVLPNRPILDVWFDAAFDPTIAPSPSAYAGVGGFNANTPATPGHVYRVDCTANCASFTWTDKTGNLPDIPVDSLIVNPRLPQQVFAGTDWGLYFTDDINAGSPIWYRFDAGLPSAMIWDMQIDRGSTTLSVWTRGRGAYVWPLPDEYINKLPQTITFDPLSGKTYGDADFSVNATASSGLQVEFSAGGNCTISGNLVHITGAGSCTITASQPGNYMYEAAPDVEQSFDIAKADQTIDFAALSDKTFADPPFNVTATASSGLPVSFSASGNCTVVGNTVSLTGVGSCTITASQPGDDNYNPAADVPRDFSITAAVTNLTVSVSPSSVQYSDSSTLQAVVNPASVNGDPATGSVEFFIDAVSVGSSAIDATGTATLSVPVTNGPGNHNVTASFTSTNANFSNSSGGPTTLTVTQENAEATYTGNMLAFTAPNSSSASVLLRVTVRDSSVVAGSGDTQPGDVRNATVTFKEGSTTLCGPLNVALINGDTTTGTASCTVVLGLDAHQIDVIINNYYVGSTSAIVEVAQPNGSFATGGGYLTIANAGGTYAADTGSKMNFGFNVSYKNARTPKGHVNIVFRSGGNTYQIKSTAIDSLGITFKTPSGQPCSGPASPECYGIADFRSKANLTGVGGNLTLQMTLTDKGEPGASDTIGITLWNGNNLLLSSEWTGAQTIETLLGGGNLAVH